VRRLQQLRGERAERRERVGQVRLTLDAGERSGKRVAELEGVSKSFGGRPIVRDLDLRLMRGDRLALIGPNGAGKSTLLKLILGTLAPDAGRVTLGTQLEVAYFDQMRAQLDPEKTVAETIAPGSDWIEVGGSRKHVMSYLGDFLFPPRRASAPVRTLSGGERNRLLLARLFARPANLLVLDEPTNDLDIDSLELLESTLQDYRGTLLLVSHDRAFVDAIATQTLVSEGDGRWREYVGGYSDWIAQRPAAAAASSAASGSASAPTATAADASSTTAPAARERQRVKLSYKEQRALESLPAQIEALEAEHAALHAAMAGADYHQASAEQMRANAARVEAIDTELGTLLEQWTTLEDKARLAAEGRG
jgi:ATP-binding cassette subfamily F protein uup